MPAPWGTTADQRGACDVPHAEPVLLSGPRVDLHPLPLPVLEALLAEDLPRVRSLVPFEVQADSFAGDAYVLALRRDQLRGEPAQLPWLYRAAVLRDTGRVVGRGGFHAPPDAAGTVEIGYRVHEAARGQGIATEMARTLLTWAAREGAVRCLGSTAPGNAASQAVLARLGFVRTGEAMDEVDGLELVFTADLRPFADSQAPPLPSSAEAARPPGGVA